ncbi:MAG: RimK/LysX family protein [Gammaproteobacteria bacterium]|nr:RimK/LysX family protein [Gammaproteobacteria bacterium]MBT8134432.1 RimK/LysX family protein [Gammaproteobacteria bacterium]NNJ50057.1 hypothetical protein [Gammaproteobacteria bacterium]
MHPQRNRYPVIFTVLSLLHTQAIASQAVTAGWVEKAVLYPSGTVFHAKLDTGAKTTSINAVDVEFFQRDGKRWSKFKITNRDHETITIEAPLVREATIKRHFGKRQKRPVIMLDICIGNVRKKEEVNLVDRANLNYQLLVGRNFLKGDLLIDSGSTYRLSPGCPD